MVLKGVLKGEVCFVCGFDELVLIILRKLPRGGGIVFYPVFYYYASVEQ